MAVFYRNKLSGSTDGKGILISAITSGTANLIHTAVSGTTNWDKIYLWACNIDKYPRRIVFTSYFGDKFISPEVGLCLIIPGELVQNGTEIKAYVSDTSSGVESASQVVIYGYVDEIRS